MGAVETGIALMVGMFFYVRYRMSSYELAVERRERMVGDINKILLDDTVSAQAKSVALYMFTKAPVSGHVPKMFILAAWRVLLGRKATAIGFTQHDDTVLRRLFNHHLLPINLLAGVHWYVLGAIVVLIVYFFAGIAHIAKLETLKKAFAINLMDGYGSIKPAQ